jgi:hypothetical protein
MVGWRENKLDKNRGDRVEGRCKFRILSGSCELGLGSDADNLVESPTTLTAKGASVDLAMAAPTAEGVRPLARSTSIV